MGEKLTLIERITMSGWLLISSIISAIILSIVNFIRGNSYGFAESWVLFWFGLYVVTSLIDFALAKFERGDGK